MKKSESGYLPYIAFHPVEGFEELVYYKAGSVPISIVILVFWFLSKIIERQATGFALNNNNLESINVIYFLIQTVCLFILWCASNWAFCTLMDGKGTFRNIWISCSYSLVPMILCTFAATILSCFLTKDEGSFPVLINILGIAWSILLMVCAIRTIHDYSFGKTALTIFLTIFGIACIIFLLILSISLYTQVIDFFKVIFNEVMFRF